MISTMTNKVGSIFRICLDEYHISPDDFIWVLTQSKYSKFFNRFDVVFLSSFSARAIANKLYFEINHQEPPEDFDASYDSTWNWVGMTLYEISYHDNITLPHIFHYASLEEFQKMYFCFHCEGFDKVIQHFNACYVHKGEY